MRTKVVDEDKCAGGPLQTNIGPSPQGNSASPPPVEGCKLQAASDDTNIASARRERLFVSFGRSDPPCGGV